MHSPPPDFFAFPPRYRAARRRTVHGALLVLGLGWAVLTAPAPAAPSGQIAFLSGTEQEDLRVCVVDVTTAAVTPVGAGNRDTAPSWSPDGSELAYTTRSETGMVVQVVRADGTDRRQVPHKRSNNYDPRWSNSGKAIAYSADDGDGLDGALMVFDFSSNEEQEWGVMAARPEYLRGFLRPVWLANMKLMGAMKPDQELAWEGVDFQTLLNEASVGGALLALGLVAKGNGLSTEIYLVTRTQAVPMLPFVTEDSTRYVEWFVENAPNGERVAFESNDGGDREIFGLGRTGLHDLSNHPAADWHPVWSYDSEQIVFESTRSGRRGVYRVYADTARVMPVAVHGAFDCWAPTWSPDGEWISFVSDRSGTPDVYVCKTNGDEVRALTGGGGVAYAPAWRPVAKGKK